MSVMSCNLSSYHKHHRTRGIKIKRAPKLNINPEINDRSPMDSSGKGTLRAPRAPEALRIRKRGDRSNRYRLAARYCAVHAVDARNTRHCVMLDLSPPHDLENFLGLCNSFLPCTLFIRSLRLHVLDLLRA